MPMGTQESVTAKAKRIDAVRGPVDSPDEVRRRLPEVDLIRADDLRAQTIAYFIDATPGYFWDKPASVSGKYHPPDERGQHGLWLHTKRVAASYEHVSRSLLELGEINEWDVDCGLAAALIHDTYQAGWPSDNESWATNHDVIAAAVAHFVAQLPDTVVRLVHTHMGPWGGGQVPTTAHERLFHYADLTAAAATHEPSVYEPADELLSVAPNIGQRSLPDTERFK